MNSALRSLHTFLQTSGLLPILDHWQGLIAGLLGLFAGLVAFGGALVAACLQVRAMRRATTAQVAAMQQTTAEQVTAMQKAARDQVAAVESQLADTRAVRDVSEQRRRIIIQWAVKMEGRRLEDAARARKAVLPSAPQQVDVARDQLIIEGSPLLRGEHDDLALLDEGVLEDLLGALAGALHAYNAHIETLTGLLVPLTTGGTKSAVLIDADALRLLDELAAAAEPVAAVYEPVMPVRSP